MKDRGLKTLGCGKSPKLFAVEDPGSKLQGRWWVEKTEVAMTVDSCQPRDPCLAYREQKGKGKRRLLTVDPISVEAK